MKKLFGTIAKAYDRVSFYLFENQTNIFRY